MSQAATTIRLITKSFQAFPSSSESKQYRDPKREGDLLGQHFLTANFIKVVGIISNIEYSCQFSLYYWPVLLLRELNSTHLLWRLSVFTKEHTFRKYRSQPRPYQARLVINYVINYVCFLQNNLDSISLMSRNLGSFGVSGPVTPATL